MFNYLFKRSIPGKDGKRHFRREKSVNREPHFCENWCYRGCWKKQKTTPVKSRENARITHWFGVGHREPFLPIDFWGKIRMNGYIRTILAQKRFVVDLSHIFHGYSIFTYPWRVDFCGMKWVNIQFITWYDLLMGTGVEATITPTDLWMLQ